MTSPAPSGGSSPLRVGGLALLGVGAVAALIGVASLVGGGGGGDTTAAGPTTEVTASAAAPVDPNAPGATPSAGAPGATSAAGAPGTTPAPGGVAVPSFGSAAPNGIAAPTTQPGTGGTAGGGSGSTGGSGSGSGVTKQPVRVYNNSTIKGLAEKAADDLRAKGWPVESVANYSQGTIPTTTVYYRSGTSEQASAQSLAKSLGVRAEPRFAGLNDATPGLILIVTKEYRS